MSTLRNIKHSLKIIIKKSLSPQFRVNYESRRKQTNKRHKKKKKKKKKRLAVKVQPNLKGLI